MTFEPPSEIQVLREQARAFAKEVLLPRASRIDATREIDGDLRAALESAGWWPGRSGDRLAQSTALEELAVASAAAALVVGLEWVAGGFDTPAAARAGEGEAASPGLRGAELARARVDALVASLEPSERARVLVRVRQVVSAVAVGIGRAAIEEAIAHLRSSGRRPDGAPEEPPHWALADAATEVEAARLLVLKAATTLGDVETSADVRMGLVLALDAAGHAVDAALRIAGPEAYREGTLLERLTRDARAIGLVLGTSDQERMGLAAEILPG